MTEEDEAFEDLAKRQGYWSLQGSRKHQIMRYVENVESKGASMTDIDLIKQALEALEACYIYGDIECVMTPDSAICLQPAISALKERLAQEKALQASKEKNT